MKKVLIAGASGMLGSTLAPLLRTAGYCVTCHARTQQTEATADLRKLDETAALLDQFDPEVLVNLVALTDVDECERDPQAAYLGNTRVVENLAHCIQRRGRPCHLIQISTDQVYDGVGPHVEEKITIRNHYGASKYAAELAAHSVSHTILRTNFFGRSENVSRTSLSDWLTRALTKGDPVTVFEDVYFSPLVLPRLARFIQGVIANPLSGTYNLGSDHGMSKADFAFAHARALDLPTATMRRGLSAERKLRAPRPSDMRMDSSRFERAFGLKVPTLQEEIQSLRKKS